MREERVSFLYSNNAKGTNFASLDVGYNFWFPWCFLNLGNNKGILFKWFFKSFPYMQRSE